MSAFKRRAALSCNAKMMGEEGPLYFWTFTFPDRVGPRTALQRWNVLRGALRREFPQLKGIRVIEMHPGGHGAHIHMVTNCYMRVERVRLLALAREFGRIHVKLWIGEVEDAANNLSQYVSKGEGYDDLAGVRLVGHVGLQGKGVSQRDIKTFGAFKTLWSATAAALVGFSALPWVEKIRLVDSVHWAWLRSEEAQPCRWAALNLVKARTIQQVSFNPALWSELRAWEAEPGRVERQIYREKRWSEYQARRFQAEKSRFWWADAEPV